MRQLSFTVYGTPQSGGSKTPMGKRANGSIILRDANPKVYPWKDQVAQVAGREMGMNALFRDCALQVEYTFFLRRPRSHYRSNGDLKPSAPYYHIKTPDCTKLVRGTEDAMKGVVFHDDSQCMVNARKLYTEGAEGVEITITTLEKQK